jgi:hypothetical protein
VSAGSSRALAKSTGARGQGPGNAYFGRCAIDEKKRSGAAARKSRNEAKRIEVVVSKRSKTSTENAFMGKLVEVDEIRVVIDEGLALYVQELRFPGIRAAELSTTTVSSEQLLHVAAH